MKQAVKIFISLFFLIGMGAPAHAQEAPEEFQDFPQEAFLIPEAYETAQVKSVIDEEEYQNVRLQIISGKEKGKFVNVKHGELFEVREDQKVEVGEEVILSKAESEDREIYGISDKYRLPSVWIISFIFVACALIFGRKRSLTSLIGLALTAVVLIFFVVPSIINGGNAFTTILIGSAIIALFSLYIAHGFNKRTTIAVIGTFISLALTAIMGVLSIAITKLSGIGTEEAYYLQFSGLGTIDMKGLLLGGIMVGALGVLDDVTTGQSASVEEIHKANPRLSSFELYKRGMSVGKEHMSSMINTLVLAYAGASFPLLLLFGLDNAEPLWVTLNREYMVEEIVRTLVGSTALVFAIPITTLIAAKAFTMKPHRKA